MSHQRRAFLAHQVGISESQGVDQMWERMIATTKLLEMVYLDLKIGERGACDIFQSCGSSLALGQRPCRPQRYFPEHNMLIGLPLTNCQGPFGALIVGRDITEQTELQPLTLQRVESLRRTLCETVVRLSGDKK